MTFSELERCQLHWNNTPTPNGKIIADERCSCGLRRSNHSGSQGHGSAVGCISVRKRVVCPQFTWAGFIYADGTED